MANLKIQNWAIERLKPFANNARKHSDKQVLEIARSIQRFGFVNPVLVDEAGEIIAGHGRVLAADRLMMDKVPVIVLAGMSDEAKRSLRLADNRIAENSTWDEALLRQELLSLKATDVDFEGLGFDDAELSRLMADLPDLLPYSPYTPPVSETPQPPVAVSNQAPEPGGSDADGGGEHEGEDETPPPPRTPKASDDQYSMFELIMLHQNKLRLVDTINEVKLKHHYVKQEDALMHIIREYAGE